MAIVQANKQQQRREKSTKALLDAAGELVLEGGFAAMTFAAIGERAGFSRAMVTARFGSRQGLVEELLARLVVPWKERTYPAGHTNTGMESVLALLDSVLERTEQNSKPLRILNALMFEAIGGEPLLQEHLRDFHREMRSGFVRVVSRGQTDGSISPDLDPVFEVDFLISILRGVAYQWLLDPDDFDAPATMRQVRTVLVDRLSLSRCR